MKTFYRILRFVLVSVLVLPLAVPLILYVLLSLPSVQKSIAHRAEHELTALLGTDVHLGGVTVAPFNRIVLTDVSVSDPFGREALRLNHLGAGVSIWESLWTRRPVISYVELIDLNLAIYKPTQDAPLNIQPIIERFKSDGKNGPSTFDLAVNLVVIRRSKMSYDVLDAAPADSGHFDRNHVLVTGLRADLSAPEISNDKLYVDIKRLGASERSGLKLRELTATVFADTADMDVSNFMVELGNSRIAFNDFTIASPLGKNFAVTDLLHSSLETLPDTYIMFSDLSPFVKGLADINERVDIEFEIGGHADSLLLHRFMLEMHEGDTRFSAHGVIRDLTRGKDSVAVDLRRVNFVVNVPSLLAVLASPSNPFHSHSKGLSSLKALGNIDLLGDLAFTPGSLDFNGSLDSECGNIDIDCGVYRPRPKSPLRINGRASTVSFDPSALSPQLARLTKIAFDIHGDVTVVKPNDISGEAHIVVPEVEWNGYEFTDISANAVFLGSRFEMDASSSSPYLDFTLNGGAEFKGDHPLNEFYADIRNFSLTPFISKGAMRDYKLACDIDVSVSGRNPDTMTGWVKVGDIVLNGPDDKTLRIPYAELEAAGGDSIRSVTLRTPQADADLKGVFSLKTIGKDISQIISSVYPALIPQVETELNPIDCKLDIKIKEDTSLSRFFKLPVDFIYPVTLSSTAKGGDNPMLGLSVDMPFLRNKDKLIEESNVSLLIDGKEREMHFTAHTSVPTKDGMLDLDIFSQGVPDSLLTDISWVVDRKNEFKGNLNFSTSFSRDEDNESLLTDIAINSSRMVFNDSAWTVNPATINIAPGRIEVNNFSGGRGGQSISINGVASADSTDLLVLKLKDIDLDYIFESLNLSDAVQFGGRATGDFYGLTLLSPQPILYTPRLNVKGLKYNRCVMGDGEIRSRWDNPSKSIMINATITQPESGDASLVDGYIRPTTEELDFKFSANNAPVGFMAPFMSAFTSKVSGSVSGDAHLYGTFKNIDMSGDIFVKDLSLKLDFTNVTYTATDSVHIRPGRIEFNDIKLTDRYGKQASLSGYVAHNYFHDASFQFRVTDAKDFLVYDIKENQTDDPWYGKIFGNGGATVTGLPGKVDIDVDMSTAADSRFTFVLSDSEQAVDYNFITLRDRDKGRKDSIAALDPTPLVIRQLKERIKHEEEGAPSVYTMTFKVGITPDATINLLMDPVGGDKITAYGSGNLRMTYSSDGDLRMYGEYTINRGDYNFTLQDIIIKEFNIREGSRITFLGDPYAAQLDITASYTVNANLSDLDESFLEDRELNRTNVRVDALMFVRGDIRQPDITFDLEFPSLTQDIYRKVRSIVSTEDMMNRQIIYLLALNKFYTPDYMTGTHGNELVSVASSTLSSRLGSMLGQLSDNWSIAPAIRSDRGDFSDVEVDVALSSNLLNNRLLFNGNLGYRDKSLNNNSFIGDFDIRYLLNRSGSVQLKAYNRYNDQNYYLKSALTTQGVGIVFKRDFDNLFSFFRRKSRNKTEESKTTKEDGEATSVKTDSVPEKRKRISADSIFESRSAEK